MTVTPVVGRTYFLGVDVTWRTTGFEPIPGNDRSDLIPGDYIPDITTAGITSAVEDLIPFAGDLIVTTPGALIEGLDISGRLIPRAANVTARNCKIRGGVSTGNAALIDVTHAAVVNFVGEDLTLIPDNPSYWWNAIMGREYTLRRCHWQWTVDGCRGYRNASTSAPGSSAPLNITVEACYGGPLSFFSPDPNHASSDNRVHSDHFQIESGMARNHTFGNSATWTTALSDIADASVIIRFNSLWGRYAGGDLFPERWPGFNASTSDPLTNPPNTQLTALRDANTSCIQVTPNIDVLSGVKGPVTGLWVEGNWFQGAGVGVSLAGGGGTNTRNPGAFIDNTFDGEQAQSGNQGTSNAWCFSLKTPEYGASPTVVGTFTGNTNTASGGAARIGRSTA